MMLLSVFGVLFAVYFSAVDGHGYMINPPNRASLWRIDWTQPTNFNDNEYFCGGTFVQYYKNDGKCGPCGDDWRDPVPRSNENGGTFGNGIVVANYTAGSIIEVSSEITANHLGSLYFHICKLENASLPETEECFKPVRLIDGTRNHPLGALDLQVTTKLKLPNDLVCERCVLRWHYRTGNSWGMCDDGTQNLGCGNQEIFRSCADIRIVADDDNNSNPTENPTDDDDNNDDDNNDDDNNNSGNDDDDNNNGNDDDNNDDDNNYEQPCILNPNYRPSKQSNKYRQH